MNFYHRWGNIGATILVTITIITIYFLIYTAYSMWNIMSVVVAVWIVTVMCCYQLGIFKQRCYIRKLKGYNVKLCELKLKYHSHRKHYQNLDVYHPKNLLQNGSEGYWSAIWTDFQHNEYDWIIFQINEDNLYIPIHCYLVNAYSPDAVKKMKILM
eukprot:122454_1